MQLLKRPTKKRKQLTPREYKLIVSEKKVLNVIDVITKKYRNVYFHKKRKSIKERQRNISVFRKESCGYNFTIAGLKNTFNKNLI